MIELPFNAGFPKRRRQSSAWIVIALTALACSNLATFSRYSFAQSGAETPPASTRQRTYLGRTIAPPMSFSGADWLTRTTRESEERPQELLNSLQVAAGQTICDFGCGNGYHTLQLARRTGPRGRVLAVDIQPEMLQLLRERAVPRGLENIEYLLATPRDARLPPESIDLVLMVDVYHELEDPVSALQAIYKALKPSGRVAVVEFREEDPDVPILPLHKMSKAQVFKEFTAHGMKLVGQYDALPWQHVLFFARSDGPHESVTMQRWEKMPAKM